MRFFSKRAFPKWLGLAFVLCQFSAQAEPKRIVSAGGSITEIIYALGAEDQLVAVDTSSLFPLNAMKLPKIGYYRQLNTEGVLSMAPSHMIAAAGAGPEAVLEQIKGSGVDLRVIEQSKSVEGIERLISSVGDIVGREAEADSLNKSIRSKVDALTFDRSPQSDKVVFLMSVGERGLVAAGDNTVPQLIMGLLQIENPFTDLEGFKPVSIESLLLVDASYIFMPTHQVNGRTKEVLCESSELKFWAERHGCQLHFVDSLSFLGLTPRLPEALEKTLSIVDGETL